MAFSSALQIELIEQHDDVPSVYLEAVNSAPATGFHHVSSWLTKADYDTRFTALRSKSVRIAQQGVLAQSGIRLSYWHTTSTDVPVIFEMFDAADPIHEGRIRRVHNAAANWDGSKPVIEVST